MNKSNLAWMRRMCFAGFLVGAAAAGAMARDAALPVTNVQASAPLSATAANSEIDVGTYQAELDRCIVAVKNPEQIPMTRQALPAKWNVRTGEKHLEVSTKWIDTALHQIEENPTKSASIGRETTARLEALRDAAQELHKATAEKDSASTHENLNKIFARKEFQQAKGPTESQMWIRHLVRRLAEWIIRLLSRAHLTRKNGNIFAWIVMTVAFALLGSWIYRRLNRATVAAQHKVDAPGLPSDARQWIAEALAAAERGDFREAVHCGYWAGIASFEDHRLLARDRTRTPRESLRLLNAHPNEQQLLGDLTRPFELIWYGNRPASHEDWSGARTLLEKMGCLKASTAATANS